MVTKWEIVVKIEIGSPIEDEDEEYGLTKPLIHD